jgi:hypothetical protein
MVSAEIAVAFSGACRLTADLIETLYATHDACYERMMEIGGTTMADRNKMSDLANAVAIMRNTLGPEMAQAYRDIYTEEIATSALYD